MSEDRKQVTDVSSWKAKSKARELELPSGNVCLVRVMGAQAFLSAGNIPNALMPIVQQALEQAQKGRAPSDTDVEQVMANLAEDPEKLMQVFDMADAIVIKTVIEPPVAPVPAEGEARSEDVLYVDEVDVEDKMFIMQFAMGGTRDLERFRSEVTANVAVVEPS